MKSRLQLGRVRLPWLVGAGACFVAALALAGSAEEKKTVSFTCRFPAVQIATNGQNARLTMTGCQQLDRLGEPALPFRTARLLIPPGYTVEKAEARPLAEAEEMEGKWQVEYSGQAHSGPGRGKWAFMPGLNVIIYNSDAVYPRSTAELISVQRMAGFEIALVRVFPVQYRPVSGQLFYASQWDVQLTLAPAQTNAEPPLHPPTLSQAKNRVAGFVDNPELLAAYEPWSPSGAASASFDYLLITSSNLVAAFQPLVERKTQDGLAVKVATVETITNSVAGCDAPEQIRNYIRQAYAQWGISYVLLGGGTTVVPCRYAYVRGDLAPKDSYIPCDLYYACLDGSWNSDRDRHWGGPNDGEQGGDVDLLAEVYVGRAPVSSVEQVKAFVEKSVRYETQDHPNLTNALLMATFLGDFPTGPCQGADMYEPLRPLLARWQLKSLDDRPQKYPQWSRKEALGALNQSPHVVLYNGHGDADIQMRMRTPELQQLTNQWPFLVCSVGCSAAEFDHGKFWGDSFGETLVNGSAQGAFAALLNARIGWFDPKYPWKYSGEFQARFFDELLRKGHPYLGEASQRSKEELVGQVEASGAMTYRWCYYGITLLGDPHVAFKTSPAAPRALAGQAPRQARTEPRASGAPPGARDFSNAFARESSPPANN